MNKGSIKEARVNHLYPFEACRFWGLLQATPSSLPPFTAHNCQAAPQMQPSVWNGRMRQKYRTSTSPGNGRSRSGIADKWLIMLHHKMDNKDLPHPTNVTSGETVVSKAHVWLTSGKIMDTNFTESISQSNLSYSAGIPDLINLRCGSWKSLRHFGILSSPLHSPFPTVARLWSTTLLRKHGQSIWLYCQISHTHTHIHTQTHTPLMEWG